jgi:hypothetical protein
MAISAQINSLNCDANAVVGSGLAGCRQDRKRVTAIGLVPKGFAFTNDITFTNMRNLQKAGNLIMLQGVVSFEDNTADDNIITRAGSGVKVVAGQNPYEYNVTFDNGVNFHKALTSLSSYGAFDMILFDVENSIWLTTSRTGVVKGYTVGMFQNGKYMGANGTDAASQTITFQLTERPEIDERMSFVDSGSLDFSYADLTGINQVIISVDPIASAATTITVSAFLQDKTHPVLGLLLADFALTKNGVALVPTLATYSATTKKYTLTVAAVASTNIITTSLNGILLSTADVLYQSNTVTTVVV